MGIKEVYKRITGSKRLLVAITFILCVTAAAATIVTWGIFRYWYPPVLTISERDIAKTVTLETSKGRIVISIDPRSRFAAAQFTRLVRNGFYSGTRIHRVVPNLLIEGGDPLTRDKSIRHLWGQGGLGTAFKNETHRDDVMTAGTVAFTGSAAGTYGSQFFIVTKDTGWLKGRHTIIGHVTSGMDTVHAIEMLPLSQTGLPSDDIVITLTEG